MLLLMDNIQIQELIKSYLDDVSDLDVSGRDCNFSIKIVSKDFTNMSILAVSYTHLRAHETG